MRKERTNYSKEFKMKAVELSIQRGNTSEVANELNIDRKYLDKWKMKYDSQKNGSNEKSAEAQEITRLKKELYDIRMERDILKKAVSIFSKNDR